MITSMIPNVNNVFKNPSIIDMRFLSANIPYNPLINYDWSTTTTSGLRYLKDVGSTPTYNASMYFGRGAYLNGVDQTITVSINTTIQTALKRVNGVVTISETSQVLTNYMISGLGVHKDYYLFTRLLTTAEKDSYTNTPELFYAMAQADSTCVLSMPMCETDKYARNMKSYREGSELVTNGTFDTDVTGWLSNNTNASIVWSSGSAIVSNTGDWAYIKQTNVVSEDGTYLVSFDILSINKEVHIGLGVAGNNIKATGSYSYIYTASGSTEFQIRPFSLGLYNVKIDNITVKKLTGIYPITNYTSSVRDNAKNLQYGLQTCKFVRDNLGVIQSASNYLECNGTGYAIIPSHADTVNIKMTVNPTSLSGNLLSGGVTKTLTGLTLNIDNDVVINDVTPTGAIILASGFSGTIKTYTEELV